MVSVITPSVCLVFLSFLEFGYTGKKSDKIILHVPFQIIHHHHSPDYVPVPIKLKKVIKKPQKPEAVEEIEPVKEAEPIKHSESTKKEKKERKPQKQKRLKPKRKPKIPLTSTPTSIPVLESFLGIDQLFKDANINSEPIPLQTKNKYKNIVQQPKDYQFSDGTNYYDTKQQNSPASYIFTSMDHSKPVPRHIPKAKGRSEVELTDDLEYEHVGYIVFGDRIKE